MTSTALLPISSIARSRRRLLEEIHRTMSTEHTRPTVILISGARGQGKTWLLRSLYADMARDDPYWNGFPLHEDSVIPAEGTWKDGAIPEFVWLAFQGQTTQDTLDALGVQVSRHSDALKHTALARGGPTGSFVRGTAEIVAPLLRDNLLDLWAPVPYLSTSVAIARGWYGEVRRRRAAQCQLFSDVGYDPHKHAENIRGLIHGACKGVPTYLVVDDIGNADDGRRDALQALLDGTGPLPEQLTVIATVAAEDVESAARMLSDATSSVPLLLALPDMRVEEADLLIRHVRPNLSATQARRVAEGFRIPAALSVAICSQLDDPDLLRSAETASPYAGPRHVYQALWDRLPDPARRALFAWHVLDELSEGNVPVPMTLLRELWREVLPPTAMAAVPLLKIDGVGHVALADPSLRSVVRERFEESGRADQARLRHAAVDLITPYAASTVPWLTNDASTTSFVIQVLPALVSARRCPIGDGAILAVSHGALSTTQDGAPARFLRLADEWLAALGPQASNDSHALVVITRAYVAADMADEQDDPAAAVTALKRGLKDLSKFGKYNDKYTILLRLARAQAKDDDFESAIRSCRAAIAGARYMGPEARRHETRGRLLLIAVLDAIGEQQASDDEAAALLKDVRRWLPDTDPLRAVAEAHAQALAIGPNPMRNDAGLTSGQDAEDVTPLLEAQVRLEKMKRAGLQPDHPALLRQHLRMAELLVDSGEPLEARPHLNAAEALFPYGGTDADRLRALRSKTAGIATVPTISS